MPYFGWWWWPFGALFWVLVIFFLVRVLFWRRWGWGWGPWHGGEPYRYAPPSSCADWSAAEDPMVILRTRLARGEVTEEEHERLKAALER